MMVKLVCGCTVTEEGKFVVGEKCEQGNCKECNTIAQLHPFGEKRFQSVELK